MGNKIYVIRPGPVQRVADQGWSLSPAGVELTREFARQEQWGEMERLYHGPERPARQTARIISQVASIPTESNDNLRDIEGWTASAGGIAANSSGAPPREDSAGALGRITLCLNELLSLNGGRSIGVISHERILALLYGEILGRRLSVLEWLSVPVPALFVIDVSSWLVERDFKYQ